MSSFDLEKNTNKAILIMSDGEDHEEMAVNAANDASNQNVVICTIGMGTNKGVPILFIKRKKLAIKKTKKTVQFLLN